VSNLNPPGEASDFLRRLVDIAQDPKVRNQARHLVGDCDLAEDLIQETLYALIRTQAPERIVNLKAFFWKAMLHKAARLRSLAGTTLVDDPESSPGSRAIHNPASRTLAEGVVARLMAQTWLARLESRRESLNAAIPGRSADPGRYRSAVMTVARSMLQVIAYGEVCEDDSRPALQAAYPGYFDEPGQGRNSCDQRFSRARADLRILLKEVIARDELLP
jgi:DNA-directed RNA polymerase specialized sigma24 family protein